MMNRGAADDRKKSSGILLPFIICAVLAAAAIVPFIIKGGGTFTLREDFNSQMIPFAMTENRAIRSASSWVWNLDLGASLIQGFSYYHLGSPFFWITLPFSPEAFPFLTGWVMILKYAVAGATSFLFLRRHIKDDRLACIGAVLYAFSGFQTANTFFYNFHDITALFPLLLLGLDRAVEEKRHGMFVLAVFFNCLLNYFFFTQEVLFLVIYFIFMYGSRDIKSFFSKALRIIGCGLLGGGMAAVLFLPSVIYVLGNPRAGDRNLRLFYDLPRLMIVLKGLLLPADPMHDNSAAILGAWDSAACWLPLVGLGLVTAYIIRKRDRLSALIITLTIVSLLPVLNSIFLFFTVDIYMRWWYMFDLLLVLATIHVLKDPSGYPVIKGSVIYIIAAVAVTGLLFVLPTGENGEALVFHAGRLLAYGFIAAAGCAAAALLVRDGLIRKKRAAFILFSALLCIFCVITTAVTINLYQRDAGTDEYLADLKRGEKLTTIDPQYRYRMSANVLTLSGEGAGLSAFCSTVTNSVTELDALFGYEHMSKRMDKDIVPGLAELLGGRYVLQDSGEITEAEACPIGFRADAAITKDELMKLDVSERGVALLSAVLLPDEEQDIPAETAAALEALPALTADEVLSAVDGAGREQLISELISRNTSAAVSSFSRDGKGFSCSSSFDSPSVLWFSVPWEGGWKAYIDGTQTVPVKSAGMMLISVPAGAHSIEFRYHTPGALPGLLITICSFAAFGILHAVKKMRF